MRSAHRSMQTSASVDADIRNGRYSIDKVNIDTKKK